MRRSATVPIGFVLLVAAVVLAGVASGWVMGELTDSDPVATATPTTTAVTERASVPNTTSDRPRHVLAACQVLGPSFDPGAAWPEFVAGSDDSLMTAVAAALDNVGREPMSSSLAASRSSGVWVMSSRDRGDWEDDFVLNPPTFVVYYQLGLEAEIASTEYAAVGLSFDPRLDEEPRETLVTDVIRRGTAACSGPSRRNREQEVHLWGRKPG